MVNLRNTVVVSVCLTAIGLLIILYYATRQHSVYTHCKQRLFAINIATHTHSWNRETTNVNTVS